MKERNANRRGFVDPMEVLLEWFGPLDGGPF